MGSELIKPPWNTIQWYTATSKFTSMEAPIKGDWHEDTNEELEQLKTCIQPYDKTELWDLAKRITNPYELISSFSSRIDLPKSTCCLRPLSRSFFKMIEIFKHLDFFERHKHSKYKSLHICEGPGGFVEAFHHLAESKQKLIQNSFAMTLRSTHAMIPGWRRATKFLQKHENIILLYGPNKTGDIYEPENQQACLDTVGQSGAHLVTADGGFDFSEDFINQEKNILRLLINSAIILLECVAIEGDIVLKLFDCNLQATRDLICLLSSCFQNWSLYKPVTSRPCNSEWYFLGRGAHRDRKACISFLKMIRDQIAEQPTISYSSFIKENSINNLLLSLQKERSEKQKSALKEVISFCENKENINQPAIWNSQRTKTIQWCNDHRMPTEYKLK